MRKIPFGAYCAGAGVVVKCPTAGGLLAGGGRVVRLIDFAACGASGFEQPVYLVEMGDSLKVIPHEFLSPHGGGDDAQRAAGLGRAGDGRQGVS